VTLYATALEVTERNFVVLGNLGRAYQDRGRIEEAYRYYQESIRAEPRYEIGHANIGFLWLYGKGDCQRATPYLTTAVRLNPRYHQAERALAYCRGR
jgi:tetratricopeptide (TPR) repeat protein